MSLEPVAVAPYIFKGYVAERQGERDEMQDAHIVLDAFLTTDTSSQTWYCTKYGHVNLIDYSFCVAFIFNV